MRQVIKDTFFDFTAQREGFTPFMYCDTLNLVTTGVGNLIDRGARNGFDISDGAMAPAMSLPWKIKGAGWSPKNPVTAGDASQAEIKESWIRTKLRQRDDSAFLQKGGITQGGFAYQNFQPITLDLQGLKDLFNRTLVNFDKVLSSNYTGYEAAPADAQQAILSMAWAMGPAFSFPAFKLAFNAGDFRKAGELSFFKGGGGTIDKRSGRNAENVMMFNNAADAVKGGLDLNQVFFPGTVSAPAKPKSAAAGGAVANISTVASASSLGTIAKVAAVPIAVGGIGWAGWEIFKHFRGKK